MFLCLQDVGKTAKTEDLQLFRPQTPETSFTSLDFDDSGEFLLAACDDESLQLYNCKEGKHIKTLFSKKYGAHLARFTHHAQSVLYASTKYDGKQFTLLAPEYTLC